MLKVADVVCDLAFGDSGKGKVSAFLAKTEKYGAVARWAGGNNAGHTVYVKDKKYKTHMIPSGIFYDKQCIIGPGCVLHVESFFKEMNELHAAGFHTDLVCISPKCHIVTDEHIEFDKQNLAKFLGTTSKGIAPAYAAKSARIGIRAESIPELSEFLWDEELPEYLLCEGAQGFWLDQDYGNYPYVTSSVTLPYGACSLGFSPKRIGKIYGVAKVYDTRSGEDPLFPSSLLEDPELQKIAELGQEYGVTTGRPRKVNWLRLDRLIEATNISGATDIILNKADILVQANNFKLFDENGELRIFHSMQEMQQKIYSTILRKCPDVNDVTFSSSTETI